MEKKFVGKDSNFTISIPRNQIDYGGFYYFLNLKIKKKVGAV